MKEKPILFNTEMVRAILDGRKTVTRRVVKLPKSIERNLEFREDGSIWWQSDGDGYGDGGRFADLGKCVKYFDLSPYRPGDLLYVRETWMAVKKYGKMPDYYYRADIDQTPGYKPFDALKWHPSIHMPREAARIFLRVTDVRVERLQEIDDDGVVSEGLNIGDPFDDLWDSTIKSKDRDRYGWSANPWVWVIAFERTERPVSGE